MQASIIRLAHWKVDIKIVTADNMHVLQWRRHMTHDEVLLDGKTQQTSMGLWGRETIYGLVFGRNEEGQGGKKVMFVIDPVASMSDSSYWIDWASVPRGVRLEASDGLLLAHGSLDERAYDRPADFSDWLRKTMGMKW